MQQLKKGFRLEGDKIPDARASKKKRRGNEVAASDEFKRQMTRCNEQMSTMNQTALLKHGAHLQGQVTELRRAIQKMKREGEPVEDIKEEEEVMEDIQRQLNENKDKLDKMADAHKRIFQPVSEANDTN